MPYCMNILNLDKRLTEVMDSVRFITIELLCSNTQNPYVSQSSSQVSQSVAMSMSETAGKSR